MKKNIHWIIWLFIVIVLASHTYILSGIVHVPWNVVLEDTIISCVTLSLSAWGIVLLIKAYPTTVAIVLYGLIVSTVLSILVILTDWQVLKWWITGNNESYNGWLNQVLIAQFLIIWLINSWVATSAALHKNVNVLESRFQQQTDASILLREAELFKLRQQLQPHFLYNSLNSINALIMIEPDKAQEMIGKLSDFLRSSVRREAEDNIPIADEMVYIQSYLAIEAIRFGDRLQIQFEKEYTDDAVIPPFLLQPILENAIKFGVYGSVGVVCIRMHIKLETPMLLLTITNPYDAQTRPPKGTGFGLEGIQRRLFLLYGRTDLLETKNDENTFTTILKIPQPYVQSNID